MSIQNGRYSLADVEGHTFVPKKGGLPSEVVVTAVQRGTLEPTPEQLLRNPFYPVLGFRFVTFNYVWDGGTYTASLKWHKFLTDYVRADWLAQWKEVGVKPKGA